VEIEGRLGSVQKDGNYYEIRFRYVDDHSCIVVLKHDVPYNGRWKWITELYTTHERFRDFFLYDSIVALEFRGHPKVQEILNHPVTQLLMEVFDLQI